LSAQRERTRFNHSGLDARTATPRFVPVALPSVEPLSGEVRV